MQSLRGIFNLVIAVITPGILPVPASKGGAVEALIENLIKENEIKGLLRFEIISIYNEEAAKISEQYEKSDFLFIHTPKLLLLLDKMIYFFARNLFRIRKNMSYRYILQRLYYISRAAGYLHDNFYDKVLLENHPTLFWALKKRGNYAKYQNNYYFHLHNELSGDFHTQNLIEESHTILTVSRFLKQSVCCRLKCRDEDKFAVLYNGIDSGRFSAAGRETITALKNKYGIQPDEKVLIFTGRLIQEKGVKELLLAFQMIGYQKVKLLIVGSFFMNTDTSSDYEKLLYQLAECKKKDIIFTGYVPYGDMPSMYALADIAVLPSICNEAAGQTILESRVAGLPIITTDAGGIPEYVNEQCAVLLPRDEHLAENIATAIDRLLSDDELRRQMSEAAKNFEKEASLEAYYMNFVNLIQ